ncbi:conjugal transfer protein TraB [Streptomyces sp. NPDC059101]|uniref:conjugal transfer protein TraB n=1 Tax=Streptomyces sp. NPDC059101 TaxID=3346728 RepID=UPI00369581AF
MSELMPYQSRPVANLIGENRFKAVQHKLKALAKALDSAVADLAAVQVRMKHYANRSETLARHIGPNAAELDPKFVAMQDAVSLALGGASQELFRLQQMVSDLSNSAESARAGHARMYGPLDEVRDRPEKTPKAGFLIR